MSNLSARNKAIAKALIKAGFKEADWSETDDIERYDEIDLEENQEFYRVTSCGWTVAQCCYDRSIVAETQNFFFLKQSPAVEESQQEQEIRDIAELIQKTSEACDVANMSLQLFAPGINAIERRNTELNC